MDFYSNGHQSWWTYTHTHTFQWKFLGCTKYTYTPVHNFCIMYFLFWGKLSSLILKIDHPSFVMFLFISIHILIFQICCKGQTISKENYGFLKSSKKRTKLTILSRKDAKDSEFRSFFGRIGENKKILSIFSDLQLVDLNKNWIWFMHTSVNMYKVASWEMKSNKEMSPPLQYDAYRPFVATSECTGP
jgi:hypothetical protein